jgi:hypothetical protein
MTADLLLSGFSQSVLPFWKTLRRTYYCYFRCGESHPRYFRCCQLTGFGAEKNQTGSTVGGEMLMKYFDGKMATSSAVRATWVTSAAVGVRGDRWRVANEVDRLEQLVDCRIHIEQRVEQTWVDSFEVHLRVLPGQLVEVT